MLVPFISSSSALHYLIEIFWQLKQRYVWWSVSIGYPWGFQCTVKCPHAPRGEAHARHMIDFDSQRSCCRQALLTTCQPPSTQALEAKNGLINFTRNERKAIVSYCLTTVCPFATTPITTEKKTKYSDMTSATALLLLQHNRTEQKSSKWSEIVNWFIAARQLCCSGRQERSARVALRRGKVDT